MDSKSHEKKLRGAFGTLIVGFALLYAGSQSHHLALFTSSALSTSALTVGAAVNRANIPARSVTRLTNVAEPSSFGQALPAQFTGTQDAFEFPSTFEETPTSSSSVKPAIFNSLATFFFAVLFYFRRKAALAQEYLHLDNDAERGSRLSLATVSARAASASAEDEPTSGLGKFLKTITSVDYSLFLCLTFWYIGNYYYNLTNKYALKATGGVTGAPLTVASLQLLVGVLYGLFLWAAPDARKFPETTLADIKKMVPLSIAFAGAHFSTVFSMSAGAVSFGQIVKASEPAFAALLGVTMYSQSVSKAKWLSLIPVIGGVCLASAAELDFSVAALISGVMANLFAAVKANENKKAMDTAGLKDRLGTVGNQFAVTMTLAWLFSLPLVLLAEWKQLPALIVAWKTNPIVSFNTISAGLWFYLYNELATIVVKKTGAVTQSVANTAKRVIVIVACGLVLGESLDTLKLVGCSIGILGVFLYSVIDDLIKPKSKAAPAA